MTIVMDQPPGNIEIDCPRKGCGMPVRVSKAGLILTHKLPDGWRACAASGRTAEDAIVMDPPNNAFSITMNSPTDAR